MAYNQALKGFQAVARESLVEDRLASQQPAQGAADGVAAKAFGVQAISQNFLIDPNGLIIGKTLLGNAWDSRLSELLR